MILDIIAIAIVVVTLCAAILTPIVVILAAEQIARDVQAWRQARAVIEDEAGLHDEPELSDEAVRKLTTIAFCPACTGRDGPCGCHAYCGHQQCTYGYTQQLSATDSAWLRQLRIKEGTDQ